MKKPLIKIRVKKISEKCLTYNIPDRPFYTGYFVYKPWFWIGPYCVLRFKTFSEKEIIIKV